MLAGENEFYDYLLPYSKSKFNPPALPVRIYKALPFPAFI